MTCRENSPYVALLGPVVIVLGIVLTGPAAAAETAGDIRVDNATAHIMEDPVNGRRIEVYMDIENTGAVRDRLYAVRSKLTRKTMLSVIQRADSSAHGATHDDAGHPNLQMHMATRALDVAPGSTVLLRHGNSHIMLMEPTAALAVGDRFPVTLFFERAGRISIEVTIVPMDASH